MRKKPLDSLFPRTRQDILAATLFDPARSWYLSDLARHLGVQPSSLQRELSSLVHAGILGRREDGNRVYFQADPDCPFLSELRGLLLKTAGLADVLRGGLEPFADRIVAAFVYGSCARGTELSASDVDLMVIGLVGLSELVPALRAAEEKLGRPVNPSVYTPEEVARKVASGHHFLATVLGGQKLFILGEEGDLAAAPGREPRPHAHNKQTGA